MRQIGIDVGGTFTDIVCWDESSGETTTWKVPSTPENPGDAILQGVVGVPLPEVERIIHGTTVATNAILQRRGVRVAMVTTAGFRDVLEIGRTQRILDGGMFNPRFKRQKPIVPRSMRFEIQERIGPGGEVQKPVDMEEVDALAETLRELEVAAVVVCFLHSYSNPEHERTVLDRLSQKLPGTSISCSSDLIREYREFERFSTAALNAYVSPVMEKYLVDLNQRLRNEQFRGPVFTMSSNTGVMKSEKAARRAVMTVLSGPVGGVNAAIEMARMIGIEHLITYDMGGTSTDVSLIRDQLPTWTSESVVAGHPVATLQTDINTVGTGGGSIARFDEVGRLEVGPDSAGALPGPACYGRGGTEPTVTDANVVLGRLGREGNLSGGIRLDREAARNALGTLTSGGESEDLWRIAEGVIELALARMTSSIREISVQRGQDPRDFALFAFGGAGPLHGMLIAERLGIEQVVIPPHPGNFSARGLLESALSHDEVITVSLPVESSRSTDLEYRLKELEKKAWAELDEEGSSAHATVRRSADLRYDGQAFDLNVDLPAEINEETFSPHSLKAKFDDLHQETYGRSDPEAGVIIVNLRVSVSLRTGKPKYKEIPDGQYSGSEHSQPTYFGGRFIETEVHNREDLTPSTMILGPAIIQEKGSTTVVPPGWTVRIDKWGNCIGTH